MVLALWAQISQSPELWEINLCCLNHLVYGTLLWQPSRPWRFHILVQFQKVAFLYQSKCRQNSLRASVPLEFQFYSSFFLNRMLLVYGWFFRYPQNQHWFFFYPIYFSQLFIWYSLPTPSFQSLHNDPAFQLHPVTWHIQAHLEEELKELTVKVLKRWYNACQDNASGIPWNQLLIKGKQFFLNCFFPIKEKNYF